LFAAIIPALALLLASVFAPAGPPAASAATKIAPTTEICHSEPVGWLDTLLIKTRALLS